MEGGGIRTGEVEGKSLSLEEDTGKEEEEGSRKHKAKHAWVITWTEMFWKSLALSWSCFNCSGMECARWMEEEEAAADTMIPPKNIVVKG